MEITQLDTYKYTTTQYVCLIKAVSHYIQDPVFVADSYYSPSVTSRWSLGSDEQTQRNIEMKLTSYETCYIDVCLYRVGFSDRRTICCDVAELLTYFKSAVRFLRTEDPGMLHNIECWRSF